tara:strand:+ start:9753 stop:10187 length:435 start_codon:yes stop_codon:yes gene_type:complete
MIIKKRNKFGVMCYWDDEQNASKVKSRKEYLEQIDFVNWARYEYPILESLLFAPMNEGDAKPQYRSKMKSMGLTSGVSDCILLCNGVGAIELKRSRKRDSSISKEQIKFMLSVESVGGFAVVAYGASAAKEALKDYLKNNKINC